ncbi:MAG: hypothetical protein K2I36_02580 [Ureaplasma sp.]|nr:hypothetical protein [Ureaplasma sp.]
MDLNKFKVIQNYFQSWHNQTRSQYFSNNHKVYKKTIKQLLSYNINSVCFIDNLLDSFQTLTIADDLIKNGVITTYLEQNNSDYICNKINSIYDLDTRIKEKIVFNKKEIYDFKKIDLIIVPVLVNYEKYGFIWDEKIKKIINNFNGFKLAISLKDNSLEHSTFNENKMEEIFIKFDSMVLV